MTDWVSAMTPGVLATLQSLVVSAVVLLGLFVGFCVVFGFPKLRDSGPHSRVVRSLDEAVGAGEPYLPADTPRGPIDQLQTPELVETRARKTA
jgi:hypothetical protein